LDISLIEETIPREMLYIADEIFFTGSAAEITPIRSVDKINIGKNKRGPITKIIQDEYFAYINGEREDKYNWLIYI
jgi:branched-chain amino acid aminotransferase